MTAISTSTTAQRQTFGKHERLRASERITAVLQAGRRLRQDGLSLMVLPGGGPGLRAGFIVRRRLGSAVTRNLMKRRMRESYRRLKAQVVAGADLVFSANAVAPYYDVRIAMIKLLSQSGLDRGTR